MERYGIGWHKKDTHSKHLSVLDYKKQERAKEIVVLEAKLEDVQVVIDLKEEHMEFLDKEIRDKRENFRREQSVAQKQFEDIQTENLKLEMQGQSLQRQNDGLQMDYYAALDKLADKKEEVETIEKEAAKWQEVAEIAKLEVEQARSELTEVEWLKKELLTEVDGDYYLKE